MGFRDFLLERVWMGLDWISRIFWPKEDRIDRLLDLMRSSPSSARDSIETNLFVESMKGSYSKRQLDTILLFRSRGDIEQRRLADQVLVHQSSNLDMMQKEMLVDIETRDVLSKHSKSIERYEATEAILRERNREIQSMKTEVDRAESRAKELQMDSSRIKIELEIAEEEERAAKEKLLRVNELLSPLEQRQKSLLQESSHLQTTISSITLETSQASQRCVEIRDEIEVLSREIVEGERIRRDAIRRFEEAIAIELSIEKEMMPFARQKMDILYHLDDLTLCLDQMLRILEKEMDSIGQVISEAHRLSNEIRESELVERDAVRQLDLLASMHNKIFVPPILGKWNETSQYNFELREEIKTVKQMIQKGEESRKIVVRIERIRDLLDKEIGLVYLAEVKTIKDVDLIIERMKLRDDDRRISMLERSISDLESHANMLPNESYLKVSGERSSQLVPRVKQVREEIIAIREAIQKEKNDLAQDRESTRSRSILETWPGGGYGDRP